MKARKRRKTAALPFGLVRVPLITALFFFGRSRFEEIQEKERFYKTFGGRVDLYVDPEGNAVIWAKADGSRSIDARHLGRVYLAAMKEAGMTPPEGGES